MKLLFTMVAVILIMDTLPAQVPSFDEIYVTHQIDSLERLLPKQTGIEKLSTLLSIQKSIGFWEIDHNHPSLHSLAVLTKQFPGAKGHYLYFKSKFSGTKNNLDTAFLSSKAAYQQYLTQKDTTGMLSALISMGVLNLRIESKSPESAQFGLQYLKQAFSLSQETAKVESQLVGYYALARSLRMNISAAELTEMTDLIKKALKLIDQHPYYIYYKPHFLNVLSKIYEQRQQYSEAVKYSLEILKILQQRQRPIPGMMVYNIGLFYEMQKKYDLSLYYYQQALPLAHKLGNEGTVLLMNTCMGYHASLVGLQKYKQATVWGDSIFIYAEKYFEQINSTKINELVVQYEVEKKESQKRLLLQEKQIIESRSRLYLIAGTLALLGLLTVSFLGLRLRNANQKLQKAFNEILQLNKARDYFFGIIAHDLRRPLSSFQGMAELIKYYIKTKRYDQLGKISDSIDQSGQRIRQTLDNLLSWALSQREEVPYNPERILLRGKIGRVIELFEPTILLLKIDVKVDCPETLTAFADANGVELIIRNLMDNALKNLSPNGTIWIKASADSRTTHHIMIRIQDNGHGMDAQTLETVNAIFDCPETLPDHQKRSLGMILISRFIKKNQGKIEVESVLGQGTAFTFILPVWKED